MSEFNIRSESVDVEQIMKQIRARILEKRGQDYTEDQIRELASVRLEKFLEPKNLRSDLLEQFRKSRPAIPHVNVEPPAIQPPYVFDDQTLYTSHRGPMRMLRKLLFPIFKLFFNPNVLNQILHTQAQFNVDILKREARTRIETQQQQAAFAQSRAEWNALYYEVLHNLVLETTRMGIEVQNLRMKAESLSSRLDFSERRVRALEGVVQYRPEAQQPRERHERHDREETPRPQQASVGGTEGFVPTGGSQQGGGQQGQGQGDGSGRRRRRRRRGRRGGQGEQGAGVPGAAGAGGAGGAGAPGSQLKHGWGPEDGSGFSSGADDQDDDEGAEEFTDAQDALADAQDALADAQDALDSAESAGGHESEPAAPVAPVEPVEPDSSGDDEQ